MGYGSMINHKIFDEFDPTHNLYCSVGVAIIGAAGIGAASTAYSASKAADAQTNAAAQAVATQKGMYDQTRSDLGTYRDLGKVGADALTSQLPFLTSPIIMDQATLEKTPGYQFQKTQGLKATQNSAAARGLGVSGAALKGAANFVTGLADSNYQTQFANENTNRTNAFNRLTSVAQLGENAAAQTGNAGTSAANAISSAQIGAGNAQAAAANKTGQSVANFANALPASYMYSGLYGSDGGNFGNASYYGG